MKKKAKMSKARLRLISEINREIENLHKKHGLLYKELPSKITKSTEKKYTDAQLKAVKKALKRSDAHHVKYGAQGAKAAGVSRALEQVKRVKAQPARKKRTLTEAQKEKYKTNRRNKALLSNLEKYNKTIDEARARGISSSLAVKLNEDVAKDWGFEYISALNKAYKRKGAFDIVKTADGKEVLKGELYVMQILAGRGNKIVAEQREEYERIRAEEYAKKAMSLKEGELLEDTGRMGEAKESDFRPAVVKSDYISEHTRDELQARKRYLARRAEQGTGGEQLKANIIKGIAHSNLPISQKKKLIALVYEMSLKDVAKLFYTQRKFNIEYLYDEESGAKKAEELLEVLRNFLSIPEELFRKYKISKETEKAVDEYLNQWATAESISQSKDAAIRRYGTTYFSEQENEFLKMNIFYKK